MTKLPFVVIVLHGLWLAQGVRASDDNLLTSCACSVIQQIHSNNAEALGLALTPEQECPYFSDNQLLDCPTAKRILDSQTNANGQRRKRQAYNFAAVPSSKWPTFPIPYVFDSTIAPQSSYATVVRNAIAHIQAQTCIRFSEVRQQPEGQSYITISQGTGCVSFVGRTTDTLSSPISASTSCLSQFGQMLYLLTQTLGMWHESQRYDRDQYVTIDASNIAAGSEGNLGIINKESQLLLTFGLPYDYASIMQFPPQIFSKNGNFTIRTNDPLYQNTLGQRVQLSFLDTEILNNMYCSGACSGRSLARPCQNGGYQDPNDCGVCHCPDGYGGADCTDLEQSKGATCGGVITAGYSELTIKSPGYDSPGYYPQQAKCIWRITGPTGSKIGLRFFGDFGVYCFGFSCYHWVEVRYTGLLNNTGPRFCCSTLPPSLNSTTNEVLIIFQSNISITDTARIRGFQLGYKIVSPDQPTTTSTIPPTTVTTSTTATTITTITSTTTTTTPTPTTTTTKSGEVSGLCVPNPCHNMGQCVVDATSSTGFTCSCPTGLSGPLCQQGTCGGCSLTPGYLQTKCTAVVQPVTMCNVTVSGGSSSSSSTSWGWFRRGKRSMSRTTVVQQACTTAICCDNARAVGSILCAVTGWTDWSQCTDTCGGGYRYKYYYEFVQTLYAGIQYKFTNLMSQTCNLQPRQCQRKWWQWFFYSCNTCNSGFSQQGSSCQPSSARG